MRTPAFWRRERSLAAMLLGPIGRRVGAITAARMAEPGATVGAPVLCVGNLVAGGAGKTPTAIWLAGRLAAEGRRSAIVSRGYGGGLAGPVAVDPDDHTAAEVGDEPLLLARTAPTFVARDRVAGARLAIAQGADVVVLDDGFQNPALAKTFSLVVIDGGQGVGNGRCIPAGPLRAPFEAQLAHAHAALVVGAGAPGDALAGRIAQAGLPVFRGALRPAPEAAAALAGRRVVAVAGLGRPAKFVETLQSLGAEVVRLHALADHAAPSPREAEAILAGARAAGAAIATTAKDAVKWTGALVPLAEAAIVVPVALEVEDAERLLALVRAALDGG
ncbi:tetraacyldisaccharide 4'-kinase [Methylopila turkensis]|uniref:Tetraacyldisaccharide 4'-kinase n=1 Tax=Methylopila turkensis TaxID=1437816 RepID=A0A9W6N5T9_9HYPH|nr:tetraacyldisaccharide 4'-kinase [Methylopila turkensis]GLK78733.1 tetraacyldisaccharide 4'-kinase [Methylopila turkensis]